MQSLFGKYLVSHYPEGSEAYELKFTADNRLSFDAVKEHQVEALLKVENGGLYHKITDQPWLSNRPYVYTLKKPFDCFCLAKAKGFVVVWFYKPRKNKVFIKIGIRDFLKLKANSKRKSFDEETALKVASQVISLN